MIDRAALVAMTPTQRAHVIYSTAQTELANSLWRAALGDGGAPDRTAADPGLTRSDMDALLKMLAPQENAPDDAPVKTVPCPCDDPATATVPSASGAPLSPSGAVDASAALGPDGGLGPNARFRAALCEAAQRTGIPATALATIVDAEAAKSRDGSWNCHSRNPRSSAAGLGQFLNATWEGLAETPGTALNATAHAKGWLNSDGKVSGAARGALLALRYDPTTAIDGIADYARQNLSQLQKRGISTDDSVKTTARAAYLAHHLGLGDAVRFLKGGILPARAHVLLRAQVGAADAEKRIAQAGDPTRAHQQWLLAYIDRRIQPANFAI
ncbi:MULTISPECIES: peptidoglycan-binding protein [Sphingomonas]|jgi:hypothetical protein|uniref:peptidoglycan-binding protein n=1 Tax=Sphingomonas TaxID=13687 RepID=UPI001AE6A61B